MDASKGIVGPDGALSRFEKIFERTGTPYLVGAEVSVARQTISMTEEHFICMCDSAANHRGFLSFLRCG